MSDNLIKRDFLIQDFIEVTEEVMTTMAAFNVKADRVQVINGNREDNSTTPCLDITGVLGFSGGRRGSLLVTFPEKIALTAVGGMLGIEYEKLNSDIRDGVGELVNMIAGGAKTRLQARGVDFSLSIPNTVIGENHQITAAASTMRTRIDFVSQNGNFFIEVYLKEDK